MAAQTEINCILGPSYLSKSVFHTCQDVHQFTIRKTEKLFPALESCFSCGRTARKEQLSTWPKEEQDHEQSKYPFSG